MEDHHRYPERHQPDLPSAMDGLWLQIMDSCRVHRCTGGLYISAKSYAGYGACSAFLQAGKYQIIDADGKTAGLNPHTGMSYQIRVAYAGYKSPPSPGHRNRSGVHSQQIGAFSHQIHTNSFLKTPDGIGVERALLHFYTYSERVYVC